MRWLPFLLLLCLHGTAAADAAEAEADAPAGAIRLSPAVMQWRAAPPGMPAGVQILVLEGDPAGAGLYTLRLRVPAGTRLPPHWHPRDERVTVLSGRVGLAFGERFDQTRLNFVEAGGYYVNPTPAVHYVFFPVDSEVQVTGLGPWRTHPAATVPVPGGTPDGH